MDKYEISLWEDYPDTTSSGIPFLNERKLCVIGSDTMRGMARAVEPKLVTNVNGTHTLTFKMYQVYTDEITGEKYTNPFLDLLINERKIKVFWKNVWYDLLIKNRDEDTQSKSVVYTCKDAFITELSRNGYNLEYSLDLQNNTGTAGELVDSVLKNSGWRYDEEGSTKIYQKTEEPVYEARSRSQFTATKQSPDGDTTITIPANANVLIFYSSIIDITESMISGKEVQFLYAAEGYATDENDMLVLNGDCYVASFNVQKLTGFVNLSQNGQLKFQIDTSSGISTRYRAERLVKSQITEYDELFDRYVNVYTDNQTNKKVYGYERTEFTDPIMVVNLVANPSGFTSLDGWIGNELNWGVYPKFDKNTNIQTYNAKSYLKINSGYTYNSGISSNLQYLTPSQGDIKNGNTGGFHKGDKYIFRVKVHPQSNGAPVVDTYEHGTAVTPFIGTYNKDNNYQPSNTSQNYFTVGNYITNGPWTEFTLTCNISCPANEVNELGLYLKAIATRWIEEVEFFKYEVGIRNYGSTTEERINPGEVALQSVAKNIYRYYNADHDGVDDVESLVFLYEGEDEQSGRFIPRTNNYEKIATIEAKNSNRFNILQSIAENFKCWVRFAINHDETGKVVLDDEGLPEKYVTLVEYIGTDLGWCFEYGIDVKNIKRTIVSDNITTKVLVLPNDNEFGKNGFCTIARSDMNYTKENFVMDFGYYTSQGLLDQRTLDRDLYSTSSNWLGYYYNLHAYNKEYDELTEILLQKRTELTKQNSQLTVLEAQQRASEEKLGQCQADLMTLACVDTWAQAQAYAQSHADHTKVQSLMNNVAQLKNTIDKNSSALTDLRASVTKLENYINERAARQQTIATATQALHTVFFKKYARYIQEGTWQDASYIDDNKYYLDAVDVAYTSSRPQLSYDINVMRLASLEDFSSKVFDTGDTCYVIDREFFGYANDKITPYKLKIIISEITSFFDTPEKDIIKVQNYKTQFDDLFQRITATTQSLQYASGGYEKAAGAINPDKTLNFDLLQDTFDNNENWVLNASNQKVTWDSTGITITDDKDSGLKLRLMAGGLFITQDGGVTWKNAVRGDGISADILTAGRLNTSEIYVYDGNHPAFRWDSAGINAYTTNMITDPTTGQTTIYPFSKYVRFDQFGIYGYQGTEDFVPSTEDAIWDPSSGVKFGLTWKGFFLRGENSGSSLEISDDGDGIVFKMLNSIGNNSLEISTSEDIVLKTGNVKRVQIGRLTPTDQNTEYGIWVRDDGGDNIFNVSSSGVNSIGGWTLTKDSFYHTGTVQGASQTIGLYSQGKQATVQGTNDKYYILAGSKFGVTLDGDIYASGGKIGGWTITNSTLTGGNITIDSAGNISCTVGGNLKWKLDNSGLGTFHDILADYGTIAGWHISSDAIYNDYGTTLGSSNDYYVNRYTIQTNSLSATYGNVGGWTMTPQGFSGSGISLLNNGSITLTSGGFTTIITGMNSGATISGSLQLGSNGVTGGLIAYGSVSSILDGNVMNLTSFYQNFNFTPGSSSAAAWTAGSTTGSRYAYLDWLHQNWGALTPNEVRVAGIDSAYVNSWAAYPDIENYFESNGEYYLPITGKAYVYGTDIYGNRHASARNPTSGDPDNLSEKNIKVTKIFLDGKKSGSGAVNITLMDPTIEISNPHSIENGSHYIILDVTENAIITRDDTDTPISKAFRNQKILANTVWDASKTYYEPITLEALRSTSDSNIGWSLANMTLSADYTLTAKNAAGNTLKIESEYPITIPATKAYNAGAETAKATGVTVGVTGEASLNPDDQKYYANASIIATSAGIRADETEVTGASWSRNVSIDVSTPYENGKTAGRNAVAISAAQMLATDSSNYRTYDLNTNISSPYIYGDYAYSRITVSADNNTSKIVRIRTPDRYSAGETAGKTALWNSTSVSVSGSKGTDGTTGTITATASATGQTSKTASYGIALSKTTTGTGYNSITHKYSINVATKHGDTVLAEYTVETGTEAYDAGISARTATSVSYERDENQQIIWDKVSVSYSDGNTVGNLTLSPNGYDTGKRAAAFSYAVALNYNDSLPSANMTMNVSIPANYTKVENGYIKLASQIYLNNEKTGLLLASIPAPSSGTVYASYLGVQRTSRYDTGTSTTPAITGDTAISASYYSAGIITQPIHTEIYNSLGKITDADTTVNINVSNLLDNTYNASNPITASGTYTPASGKLGFSSVTVEAPSGGKTINTVYLSGLTYYPPGSAEAESLDTEVGVYEFKHAVYYVGETAPSYYPTGLNYDYFYPTEAYNAGKAAGGGGSQYPVLGYVIDSWGMDSSGYWVRVHAYTYNYIALSDPSPKLYLV